MWQMMVFQFALEKISDVCMQVTPTSKCDTHFRPTDAVNKIQWLNKTRSFTYSLIYFNLFIILGT